MGLFKKIFGGGTPKKQPLRITDANFTDEVIRSTEPVIVDVWSENCASCVKFEPILMQLAGKFDGQIKVCEMKAEDAIKACRRLKIMGTPTVLYFAPKGIEVERVVGFRNWLYHKEIAETELLKEA